MYKTIMNMINECLATWTAASEEVVSITSTPCKDWSLQAQDAKRILALYDRIPSGQLAMLESADMDIAAIGSGIGHMNVQ